MPLCDPLSSLSPGNRRLPHYQETFIECLPSRKHTVLSSVQCLTIFWVGLITAPRIWMCCPHWKNHNLHGNLILTHVRLPGQRMLFDLPQDSPSLKEGASSSMGWCGCQPRGLGQAWGMQLAPAHQIPKEHPPPPLHSSIQMAPMLQEDKSLLLPIPRENLELEIQSSSFPL